MWKSVNSNLDFHVNFINSYFLLAGSSYGKFGILF